ncbi:hypothetical protein N9C58_00150 [bacterium]|nr:hypothetical protein [bacterium]
MLGFSTKALCNWLEDPAPNSHPGATYVINALIGTHLQRFRTSAESSRNCVTDITGQCVSESAICWCAVEEVLAQWIAGCSAADRMTANCAVAAFLVAMADSDRMASSSVTSTEIPNSARGAFRSA